MLDNNPIIEVKNVSLKFNIDTNRPATLKEFVVRSLKREIKSTEFWALNDLSFEVQKGDVIGIIGHNGAGKSTLLKVISGIMKPTKGEVIARGSIVPMLELGSGFDFDLTGRENIFLNGAILGYSKEYLENKYSEIVEFSELGDFIDAPIRTYSSGMLARLAFSVACVVEPEILIVDEILAVGDADFQEKSRAKMKQLMDGGTTVFFVSHNMNQIEEMCNKVLWIEHGTFQEYGETEKVCADFSRQ